MKKLYLFLFSVFIFGSISNASVPGDAGVISVQIMPGACPGLIDVYAEVKNHGATAIDSVFIDWTVNSVPEASLNYQTVINPGDSVTVLIGSSLFLAGVTHDVQAWTRDPNGATDLDQTNDTSMISGFIPGMNGTYTIGGASPDFMSFTDAIAALNNAGLCGPVEFNVRTGMYTEQIIFPEIAGSSIVNTITFNSELSDSSSVVLTFPAGTSLTENYTMQLNGVDNITFVNMTFERSGTGSASTVVEITNQSDGVSFISNQFLGDASASGSNATGSKSGIYSPITDNNNDLVIRGNYFKDNANGLWINGDGTSHASGMVVENNVFENFYVGAFLLYQTAPQITGNTIIRNNTSSTVDFYGISVRFTEGPLFISKNAVTGHTGNYGIRLRDCVGTMGNEGIIVNNFVQVGGGGTSRGISLEDNCAYQQVYNNSVNNVGTHLTNGTALYVMGPLTTNLDFMNNILANAGGGYAVNFVDSSQNGLINSNFNCFFSIGDLGNWFGAQPTLLDFQTASGLDANSVSGNPTFTSQSDLHTTSALVSNLGTPIAIVLDDIDGDLRDALTPDIGADEFLPTSLSKRDSKSKFVLYPNPALDRVSIVLDQNISKEGFITVNELSGKLIKRIPFSVGQPELLIDISSISSGVYFIGLESDDSYYHQLLIKSTK